jgi:hypothetical protein
MKLDELLRAHEQYVLETSKRRLYSTFLRFFGMDPLDLAIKYSKDEDEGFDE